MKSTSTNISGPARCPAHQRFAARRSRSRGVAEIELLLVIIFVLIPMLLLVAGANTLGTAILNAVFNTENNAYTQVVPGVDVKVSDDLTPTSGFIALRPDLPNRIDFDRQTGTTTLNYGSLGKPAFVYSEKAAFLDPSWHLSAYPGSSVSGADNTMIRTWFEEYLAESHSAELTYSLGLKAPGPP